MTEWATRLPEGVVVDFGLPNKTGKPNEDYPLGCVVRAESLCHDLIGLLVAHTAPAPILVNEDYRILLLSFVFRLEEGGRRKRPETALIKNKRSSKGVEGVEVISARERLCCPLLENLIEYHWNGGRKVYVKIFFCAPFAPSLPSPEEIMEGIKNRW